MVPDVHFGNMHILIVVLYVLAFEVLQRYPTIVERSIAKFMVLDNFYISATTVGINFMFMFLFYNQTMVIVRQNLFC